LATAVVVVVGRQVAVGTEVVGKMAEAVGKMAGAVRRKVALEVVMTSKD
jgi:hypothetical protein